MRFFYSLLFLSASIQSTLSADAPSMGILYNTVERAALTFECRPAGPEKLSCDFVQTSVRRKLNPADVAGKLEAARAEFIEKKTGISEGECKEAATMLSFLEGKQQLPSGVDLSKLSAGDRSYAISLSKALVRFCEARTIENFTAMSRVEYEKQTRTCLVASTSFRQTFNKTVSGIWIVSAERTGECGVVRLDRFEPDNQNGITFWKYTSRKAVTDPNSNFGLFSLSCSGLDQREYPYSWRARHPEFSCESVEFSPI